MPCAASRPGNGGERLRPFLPGWSEGAVANITSHQVNERQANHSTKSLVKLSAGRQCPRMRNGTVGGRKYSSSRWQSIAVNSGKSYRGSHSGARRQSQNNGVVKSRNLLGPTNVVCLSRKGQRAAFSTIAIAMLGTTNAGRVSHVVMLLP